MEASYEEMKAEAIRRMKQLGLIRDCIEKFDRYGLAMYSERCNLCGYWKFGDLFDADEAMEKSIDEFNKTYDALVYAVIRNYTELGIMDTYLFVSKNKDEWVYDDRLMAENAQYAYVKTHGSSWGGEFGRVGVRPAGGGLLRTW